MQSEPTLNFEGIIIRFKNRQRLIVWVTLLQRSAEPGQVWNRPAARVTRSPLGRSINKFDRELEQLKSIRDRLSRASPIGSERRKTKENDRDRTSNQRHELSAYRQQATGSSTFDRPGRMEAEGHDHYCLAVD